MKVGDLVKGKPGAPNGIANEKMTKGVVTRVDGNSITVKVIEHDDKYENGKYYSVIAEHFEVIGHVKPFNRD